MARVATVPVTAATAGAAVVTEVVVPIATVPVTAATCGAVVVTEALTLIATVPVRAATCGAVVVTLTGPPEVATAGVGTANAATGTGEAGAAMRELGLSLDEISTLDADQAFFRVAESLQGVTDRTQQARASQS